MNHVYSNDLPRGSFFDESDRLRVASPQLCLVQMARHLPVQKTIELGIELCGKYRPCGDGFTKRLSPLTTPVNMQKYLAAASWVRGSRCATKALPWIAANSASPRETELYMLLCLPPRYDGYGFPPARLNYTLPIHDPALNAAGYHSITPDLWWPGVVVEYESNEHHSDAASVARDSMRRSIFAAMKYHVVTVTWKELSTPKLFERVVSELERILKVRKRPRGMGYKLREILREPGLMNYHY